MTLTSNPPTLHAIGNAHIDPVWLWRWPEGIETIRATFRSALDRMKEYPDFVFTGSSAAFYAWLKLVDPGLFGEVRERVREGRWEIVGGWWIQPDANIPCGESFARQALYGQRFFLREFGVLATAGYNPDTFGHVGTLPQILRKAGLTRYVFMRPMAHEKQLPGNVFRWRAPDGSEVLAARIARGYGTWGDELSEHVQASRAARPDYLSHYIVFYGVGNHGGGPTKRNIDSLRLMSQQHAADSAASRIALSSLEAFFAAVEAEMAAGADVPVVADDLQHHARGCYTAESEVKRQNRRVEHLLMNAERFASAAWSRIPAPGTCRWVAGPVVQPVPRYSCREQSAGSVPGCA
ncbi:MAG: alpha-mannosidase [Chloroflexi bacterium]|nr:alpha-mannosidase [Chloroflexota bacterium]